MIETPREYAFCAHAILDPATVFEIKDASQDQRFFDNPLVTGGPIVISYCGVPLVSPSGLALGTLCVIDHKPGGLSSVQVNTLKALANQVIAQFELRKNLAKVDKMLEELQSSFENLSKFSYTVAHDLKGPLNNIHRMTSMIKEDYSNVLDDTGKHYLTLLEGQSEKLTNLVSGILHSATRTELTAMDISSFPLRELLDVVLMILAPEASFSFKFPDEDVSIKAYRYGLHMIFQNLIGNAIKYNDKEKGIIEIGMKDENDHYLFFVKDNGQGIAPEFHTRIFQNFQTLGKLDRYKRKGTGIGLSTVKNQVERMNGKIWLESTEGEGSTFYFSIPK